MDKTTDWRDGVRIVRGAAVAREMRDPGGIGRATAAQFSGGGAGNVWIGAVSLAPGDFAYFVPHVPHQERNPSAAESVDFLVVRTDAARLALKLDADPVATPETVA
ncbi:MAG: hypothetical protein ACK5U4_21830 [Rhodospirillales bacterium]|jgi:uncharacterized RmlC-like cupin family protein|nr:hypothetical protein [Magnetospirillum sp.]